MDKWWKQPGPKWANTCLNTCKNKHSRTRQLHEARWKSMKYNEDQWREYSWIDQENILSAICLLHSLSSRFRNFLLIWMPLKAPKSKVESNAVRLRCCACDFDLHVYCHLVRLPTHASAGNWCKIDIRTHVAGLETLQLSRQGNRKELEAMVCPTIMHTESFMSTMIGIAKSRAREITVQPSFLQPLPETLLGDSPQWRGCMVSS